MSKTIRQISIRGSQVTIFYTWDRPGPGGKGPSRQIKTFTKITDLDKLESQRAIDMEKMEELL